MEERKHRSHTSTGSMLIRLNTELEGNDRELYLHNPSRRTIFHINRSMASSRFTIFPETQVAEEKNNRWMFSRCLLVLGWFSHRPALDPFSAPTVVSSNSRRLYETFLRLSFASLVWENDKYSSLNKQTTRKPTFAVDWFWCIFPEDQKRDDSHYPFLRYYLEKREKLIDAWRYQRGTYGCRLMMSAEHSLVYPLSQEFERSTGILSADENQLDIGHRSYDVQSSLWYVGLSLQCLVFAEHQDCCLTQYQAASHPQQLIDWQRAHNSPVEDWWDDHRPPFSRVLLSRWRQLNGYWWARRNEQTRLNVNDDLRILSAWMNVTYHLRAFWGIWWAWVVSFQNPWQSSV